MIRSIALTLITGLALAPQGWAQSKDKAAQIARNYDIPWDSARVRESSTRLSQGYRYQSATIRFSRDSGLLRDITYSDRPVVEPTDRDDTYWARAERLLSDLSVSLEGYERVSLLKPAGKVVAMRWARIVDNLPCLLDSHSVTLSGDHKLVGFSRAVQRRYAGGPARLSETEARRRAVEITRHQLEGKFDETKEFRRVRFDLVQYYPVAEDLDTALMRPTWQVTVASGVALVDGVTGESMGFMATKGGVNPTRPKAAQEEAKPAAERRTEPGVAIPVAAGAGVAGITAVWWWRRRKL